MHGTRVVGLLYGQRSLLMQATDPLAFAGLVANSEGQDAPFARLTRTALIMERVFFGTRAEADRETRRVRAMHRRVRGTIDRPAGRYRAGSEYRADDPAFLLWILACLADSAQAVYETFVRRLDEDERERFWQDYLLVGELFGLPRTAAPRNYLGYRDYMAERLASDDLHVTPEARALGRKVAFELPVDRHRLPALAVTNFAVAGLLPDRVRRLYGLPWNGAARLAFEGLAISQRATAPLVPGFVRRGRSASQYELIERGERRRLARTARPA